MSDNTREEMSCHLTCLNARVLWIFQHIMESPLYYIPRTDFFPQNQNRYPVLP